MTKEVMKAMIQDKKIKKSTKETIKDLMQLFLDSTDSYYLFCSNGLFYYWNDKFWEEVSEFKIKAEVGDWLGKDFTLQKVNNIVECIKIYYYTDINEMNKDSKILIFKNGNYDLDKKIFTPLDFMKELKRTSIINYDYNPNASMDRFNQFLKDITENDEEKIAVIQEMFGYCLTDSCALEKAFVLYGEGGTGKSTLLNVLKNIIGTENISNIPMNRLNETFSRASLYGKKINMCAELENNVNDSAYLKSMISGEEIDAQFKFKDTFKFYNTAKMIFAMNNLPTITDKSTGIYRRLIIIPFNRSFTANDEQDIFLSAKLAKESEGILLWAIEGYHRLMANGKFTISEELKEMVEQYKVMNDPIQQYVNERIQESFIEHDTLTKDEIFADYMKWCLQNNYRPMNNVNFFKNFKRILKVEEKQVRKGMQRVRAYEGIQFTK